MSMTKLEEVLANALKAATNVDIPAIIEAAQACVIGGPAQTVQETPVTTVIPPAAEPATEKSTKRTRKAEPTSETPSEVSKPAEAPASTQPPVAPAAPAAPAGVDLSGLFSGSGASKKLNKEVFLAAVEKAGTLAALVALNATCDCGYATGAYTEDTAGVLKNKLLRWGNAQE